MFQNKYSLILIFCLFLGSYSLAQESVFDLIAQSKYAYAEDLTEIFTLDVFAYFSLTDNKTELQREILKKTPEYQSYLTQLKSVKAKMLSTTYFVKLENAFEEIDYNIKLRGFELLLGTNWGSPRTGFRCPKCFGRSILLKTLPTKQVEDSFVGNGWFNEIFFVQLDETKGLEIESNRKEVQVYFFFNVTGQETIKYRSYNINYPGWIELTDKPLYSVNVRVAIINKQTNQIYYDKSFTRKGEQNHIDEDLKAIARKKEKERRLAEQTEQLRSSRGLRMGPRR